MIRLTSRFAAAGVLALGLVLATTLANALPASASSQVAGSAALAKGAPASTARIGLAPPPSQRVTASPDIEEESCTSSRATWVHVYADSGTFCLGYTGLIEWSVPPEIYTFCAGNNYGYFETYYEPSGTYSAAAFSEGFGRDYPNLTLLVYVEIDGWSGSDSC